MSTTLIRQAKYLHRLLTQAVKKGFDLPFAPDAERLDHAIATMQMVVEKEMPFNLGHWLKETPCGTSGCLMGHIALTPEWTEAGGTYNIESRRISFGTSKLTYEFGVNSALNWFKIPSRAIMECLITPFGSTGYFRTLVDLIAGDQPEENQPWDGLLYDQLTERLDYGCWHVDNNMSRDIMPTAHDVLKQLMYVKEHQKLRVYICKTDADPVLKQLKWLIKTAEQEQK